MEISASQDPVELFQTWLKEAAAKESNDPEAMALATVGKDGQPSVRMVLLKQVDAAGFAFYTNMESRKGEELAHNSKAALCFHWKSLGRQVRVEGVVKPVSSTQADEYFQSRHPLSRLGAWASRQSKPLKNRAELETRVKEFEQKFKGQEIPRPPHWSGYCVVPDKIEFWQEGDNRLHDRFLFTRDGGGWTVTRLNP